MFDKHVWADLIGEMIHRSTKTSLELAKIKGSMAYLKSIRSLRLIVMNFLGMAVCLALGSGGLIIFHSAFLLYGPWSLQTRITITFIAAALYLGAAIILFVFLQSEKQWMKIFKADEILSEVVRAEANPDTR